MKQYHKIHTIYKRDPNDKHKTLLEGQFSLPEFEYLKDNKWIFTEKVDGTNIRVMWDGRGIGFQGKTDNAQIPAFLVNKLNEKFSNLSTQFKEKFGEEGGVCLYGEGYGAKIQKGGGNYRPDQDFVLFDVNIGGWWLQRKDIEEIAKFFCIDVVPIKSVGTLDDLVELAKLGFDSRWGQFQAEGIVARPEVELRTRGGYRIITKIKCKDFDGK